MTGSQKFFAFLLLPALTFLLGISVAQHHLIALPNSGSGQGTFQQTNTVNLDTAIFHTALERWKAYAGNSDADQIQKFEKAVASTEQKLKNFQEIHFDIFWEALNKVKEKYLDPTKINMLKISEGIIRGLIFSLDDPYSTYLSPEESNSFDQELSGELDGIGAELTMKNNFVTVVSPIKNSPAAQAGILPEDIILKVNDEDIQDFSLNEVVEKIRGPKGSTVKLTLLRPSSPAPLEKEVQRDHIVVETVHFTMQDDIAILEVTQFGDNTDAEFDRYLREAVAQKPKGIVLDLRFNPGGYLESAVNMVSAFQSEGKVVIQKERDDAVETKFVTQKLLTSLPMVVLINKGSASAAEIVAGALQDYKRATVIGETSFGKGTVQELVPMSDGSNLRLTIAKWLTPNGRDIAEKGIQPDITIVRTPEDFAQEKDPQLDAALKILSGAAKAEDYAAPVNTSQN